MRTNGETQTFVFNDDADAAAVAVRAGVSGKRIVVRSIEFIGQAAKTVRLLGDAALAWEQSSPPDGRFSILNLLYPNVTGDDVTNPAVGAGLNLTTSGITAFTTIRIVTDVYDCTVPVP